MWSTDRWRWIIGAGLRLMDGRTEQVLDWVREKRIQITSMTNDLSTHLAISSFYMTTLLAEIHLFGMTLKPSTAETNDTDYLNSTKSSAAKHWTFELTETCQFSPCWGNAVWNFFGAWNQLKRFKNSTPSLCLWTFRFENSPFTGLFRCF